jgi:hypothetical protein
MWLLLAASLNSCIQTEELTTSISTLPISITQISAKTAYPINETPTSVAYPFPATEIQTAYPVLTATPGSIVSFTPVATKIDEQIYIDPDGWYSVNIPAEWENTESPNSFVGENGFFSTGYLPEMMYMAYAIDICQWLANINTKDTYSVVPLFDHNGCILTTLPEISPPTIQAVIENPAADFPQRFLFIETDAEHFDSMMNTFTWLQPIDQYIEPAFHLAPLSSEDEIFWEYTSPLPVGFSIEEYKLPDEAQKESPSEKIFLEFIPPDAPREDQKPGTTWSPDTWEDINEKIEPFGYELRPTAVAYLYQLYKDGVMVFDNIYELPSVYQFPTSDGKKITFFVRTLKNPDLSPYSNDNAVIYLVENDVITQWEEGPGSPIDPKRPPILVEDELLWLQVGENTYVQVQNNQRDTLFSFATYFGARLPVNKFRSWNNHWILEIGNFVIQDGEIFNEKYGFEEAFDWYEINDKPFYFFRRGPRVGISYDGNFLPVYYHEVVHGYCCGLALNNPRMDENSVRFFGKRDDVWYYVIMKFNSNNR